MVALLIISILVVTCWRMEFVKNQVICCIFTFFLSCFSLISGTRFYKVDIQFPAHNFSRTAYNAAVLDIEPFTLHISLPEGWYIQVPSTAEDAGSGFSPVYLCEGDTHLGILDYNTFAFYADATDENFYRSVYSQLMGSQHVT